MKEKRVFDCVPVFSDKQIDKQVEKQIMFLKVIYPQLADSHWNEGRIEIRPVKRDPHLGKYLRSYGTWHFRGEDIAKLKEFLQNLNGMGVDLYFSGFAFDYAMEVYKENGEKYEKGKVNKKNALFTSILPMDFDDITTEEFRVQKQRLLQLGIETIDVFTGHGFQSFILLNHKVSDKDIFKKFTTLMLAKGFKVDEAVQDPARVLRMPYSFNCKALDPKSKYYSTTQPEIIATTEVSWTEKRYHITEVFEKINSLTDVIKSKEALTEIDLMSIPTLSLTTLEKRRSNEKSKREIEEVKGIRIETLRAVYPMLDFEHLPGPIQKMLVGSQEGLRNKVMMFMIPFLRNSLGLNIQTIKEIMVLWGERCIPSLNEQNVLNEVDRIYSLGFKGKHGNYTEELRKAYGYVEFEKFTKRNKIIIPNNFLENLNTLSDGAVRIYLSMKLNQSLYGANNFNKMEIQSIAQISERTLERNMRCLVSTKHVSKRRGNRRIGEGHVYYINPYFNTSQGFTMIEIAVIKSILNELTDGELKLYIFLLKIVGESGTGCWTSQSYIAEKIGKKGQDSISKMTSSMHGKGFITKKTTERDGVKHSVYNLNF
ncbi:helix-turn-helix domain-containing protein [Neobacillus mesonae]|nr:helix-turn-helix domain-containing protein [Neobacillus mesonae]